LNDRGHTYTDASGHDALVPALLKPLLPHTTIRLPSSLAPHWSIIRISSSKAEPFYSNPLERILSASETTRNAFCGMASGLFRKQSATPPNPSPIYGHYGENDIYDHDIQFTVELVQLPPGSGEDTYNIHVRRLKGNLRT